MSEEFKEFDQRKEFKQFDKEETVCICLNKIKDHSLGICPKTKKIISTPDKVHEKYICEECGEYID